MPGLVPGKTYQRHGRTYAGKHINVMAGLDPAISFRWARRMAGSALQRHGRACPGHPRLSWCNSAKTWMPATSAGMTLRV